MRKIVSIFLAVTVFFSSLVVSHNKAHANAGVFMLGGTSAEMVSAAAGASVVGPFVIGAILVAAGGAYIATNYGDEIKQYATQVYSNMSAAAKQSLQTAYTEAVQAGKNTITLSSEFVNELKANSQVIADWIKLKLNTAESVSITTTAWYLDTVSSYWGWDFGANTSEGYKLYVNGQEALEVGYQRISDTYPPEIYLWWTNKAGTRFDVITGLKTWDSMFKPKNYYDSLSKVMQLMTYVGLTVGISKTGLESAGYDAKTVIDNALDDVASYPVGIPNLGVKSLDGQDLTYDPTAQKWKTGAGTVVEDVVADFPIPVPRADATFGNPAIPLTDVVIGDVPFVAGDATTGEETATEEGAPTKTPEAEANRWKELVTTKFPFSLPWDLYAILSVLNAEPQKPVLKLDATGRIAGVTVPLKFTQNIDFLDPYMPFLRTFILIGYVLFLIFSTRKLLGGGQ
jgi:hypothetical protein